MRIILVTGLGGAGRTTVAAATALAEARAGRRVLLVSADADPLLSGDGLRVLRPDPAGDFRREFLALQARSSTALDLLGAAPFEDAELTALPGSGHFALLRALRDAAEGDHELAVVDLPPLTEALALLALPEQLRRYLRRLLPPERQAARALRPMLAQLAGVPMPAQWLYETTGRWETELAAVQAVVEAPTTSVRLVLEPGPAAARALRTARLGLALQRLALDSVVANRLLPMRLRGPLARRTDRPAAPAPRGTPYRLRRRGRRRAAAPRPGPPRPRRPRAARARPPPGGRPRPRTGVVRRGPPGGGRRPRLAHRPPRGRQGGSVPRPQG